MSKKYHLFEVYGIELEYMLINKNTFHVAPDVDKLFTKKNGSITSDIDNGAISWSNELVAHVVEIKTNGPTASLEHLSSEFHKNIVEIHSLLEKDNLSLLPTAMHPLMNPLTDTQLWKHNYSEVYELYNRIFNCQGHGWSNVQSTHINLPFYHDKEFEKLHAAIRLVLPLLPALAASSPIVEGKSTGFLDTRLEYYKTNQQKIPALTGYVIPERVFTKLDYYASIFEPIKKAIAPFDTKKILDHHFLNSRGAIARFDRNAIEIRLLDIQECPMADIAIAALVIEAIKLFVEKKLAPLSLQKGWTKEQLFPILNDAIKTGEETLIDNLDYLSMFQLTEPKTMKEVWVHLYQMVRENLSDEYQTALEIILEHGTLSTRIMKGLNGDFSSEKIKEIYTYLSHCLMENNMYLP